MPRKKKIVTESPILAEIAQPVLEKTAQETLGTILTQSPTPTIPLYAKSLWAGKIPNFKCLTCGTQSRSEDAMIVHVVNHIKDPDERNKVFDQLIKDKEVAG